MVEDVEFSSYYGRPIVKAPPWGDEISLYLFLGGLAGGSSLLGLGAQFSDRPVLRIATRLTAITATGIGGAALVADLGRPERFLNMMRVFKVSSPMSMGTWILSGFGVGSGVLAAIEVDRLTGEQRLPLGPLRRLLHAMETPAALESALFATPLAAYTGALLGDTAVPTWNAAGRNGLSYVFVSSAAVAAGRYRHGSGSGAGDRTGASARARWCRRRGVRDESDEEGHASRRGGSLSKTANPAASSTGRRSCSSPVRSVLLPSRWGPGYSRRSWGGCWPVGSRVAGRGVAAGRLELRCAHFRLSAVQHSRPPRRTRASESSKPASNRRRIRATSSNRSALASKNAAPAASSTTRSRPGFEVRPNVPQGESHLLPVLLRPTSALVFGTGGFMNNPGRGCGETTGEGSRRRGAPGVRRTNTKRSCEKRL